MSRPFSLALLAGLCLLIAPSLCWAQSVGPPLQQGKRPTPLFDGDLDRPAGSACPPPFDTARALSPWYVDAEMAVLVNTAVHFNGNVFSVKDDNAIFVSPRVFLGYRLEGGDSLRATYRNLTEVGHLNRPDSPPGDWSSDTTFTTNWLDLDYVSREYAPLPWWRVQWEAGGRFVFRYEGTGYKDTYVRRTFSHTYFGGGPHLGLTSHWQLGGSGWALFGRADTGATFGGGETRWRTRPRQAYPWGLVEPSDSNSVSNQECQFDASVQLGLMKRWELESCAIGLGFGVQADVLTRGNLGDGKFSSFGMVNTGLFLRCEVDF